MDFHFPPALRRFKRKMAVIQPKDAGAIIAYASLNKHSRVVEIGAGNGFLTYYLANICREVYAYEVREDTFKLLKKNLKGFDNLHLINGDGVTFEEDNLDAVIVDIPNPWDIVSKAYDGLKSNGYFVAYIPNIEQVKKTYDEAKLLFDEVFVLQLPIVEWRIAENRTRPNNLQLFHTAFLLFARKAEGPSKNGEERDIE